MKKLLEVQSKLKAPKSQTNSFGKYKYRSCEDILEAVKPLLAEAGLVLILTDHVVEVGGRVYVKATAQVLDGDNSIAVEAYAREAENKKGMDDSQITGTASSYARKYALNGLFLIDDTKDADTMDNTGDKTITVEQIGELVDLVANAGADMTKFLKFLKVTKIEDIKAADFKRAKVALEDKINKKETNNG